MFCSKCGKELPDDAVFCTYCGNPTSNSPRHDMPVQQENSASQQAQNYVTQPIYEVQQPIIPNYPMTSTTPRFEPADAPKLTQKEKNIIIVTGLLYIISGVLTAVMLLNPGSMTQLLPMEDAEDIITVSAFLGFCISTFFGVAAILKRRWAFLAIRVFMILGIVFNVISVLYFLIQVKKATDSLPAYLASQIQVDYSPLWTTFLSIGYEVLMTVFTSACAKALSQDVQYYRDKINHKKSSEHNEERKYEGDVWVCAKCGAHNSIGNSFCKDCGSYK